MSVWTTRPRTTSRLRTMTSEESRPLPGVSEGDYLALLSAGAYGFVMASNYNTRPLAAEILVNGKRAAIARARQPVKEIWSGEKIVTWLK